MQSASVQFWKKWLEAVVSASVDVEDYSNSGFRDVYSTAFHRVLCVR
jgi:hypothetical protein